jgi:hypothetical protein
MKRVITLGLCLAALSAMAAVATTAAASAAEPAFFECAKLKGGKYKGGCKEESTKGTAELVEGVGKGKTFKGKGTEFRKYVPAINDKGPFCTGTSKVVGKQVTPTVQKGVVLTFSECEAGGKRCKSAGQKTGTVATEPLEGALGYVNAAEHRVGLDLAGEGGPVMMSWSCEGLEYEVTGSLIGEISPVGVVTNTYTVTFALQSEVYPEEFQAIKSFEGGPEDVPIFHINGSGPFKGAFRGSYTYKGEKLELKG